MKEIRISDEANNIVITRYSRNGIIQQETLTMPATADATQGDFVILSNVILGTTIAAWVDIDENGIEPSGTLYSAADETVMVPIATGGTSTENGTLLYEALLSSVWGDTITLTDNEDGTVTVLQQTNGVTDVAVPKNSAEDGVGSITSETDATGTDMSVSSVQHVPKLGLKVFQDNLHGKVYLISQGEESMEKENTAIVLTIGEISNSSGIKYTTALALTTEIISFIDNQSVSNGSQQTQVVDSLGNAIDFSTSQKQDDLLGIRSQIVTGVSETAITTGYYAYGCTCRYDGSIIASLKKTVGETETADSDESITGIAMFLGEYQPFINKVTRVTQTAATDSITYWLKAL